jgi:predicted dehydrogenase/NADPH:quinone reductase-like Zn-dependent oxidoreductase
MRQILLNTGGAVVARVPRPIVEPGSVLVRVHYSLISVGTEIAPLRSTAAAAPDSSTIERGIEYASRAQYYLRASIRDPRKAIDRIAAIARRQAARLRPAPAARAMASVAVDGLTWTQAAPAAELQHGEHGMTLVTDDTPAGYQMVSQAVAVPGDHAAVVRVQGRVDSGAIAIGLLSEGGASWLASRRYETGPFEDTLIVDPRGSREITVAVTTAGVPGRSRVTLSTLAIGTVPKTLGGLPVSELDTQGWNVGYSAAGEVVGVGDGIVDLAVGDLVACAGAGQANHADYIAVKRNLVCRVPAGCPVNLAASTTVGTIALQGVRRASPQLGERVAVLGLGLIGQITAQLLRAAGCDVIGLDLDPARVERARTLGMTSGASDAETLKAIVRDATGGRGADRTLITAATKSNAVVNLAMEVTRAKGTVVLVGDVGLKIERDVFYRKEIDVLMSTSYGPGRYDAAYEVEGHDYPFAYVRWTENRNMESYLDLLARGRIDVQPLIDRVISVDEAPSAYRVLADAAGPLPLGVLIRYPDDTRDLPEPADSTRVVVRGHRPAPAGPLKYALVGAGSFGMAMLVPQMKRRRDRFVLKAVVSRNASQGGNFARENQVEILTSDLQQVLADESIDLVVIATRHHEHAEQVARSLEAGKHVFVEKPLALTWGELDRIAAVHHSLDRPPLVLVGFNRRFSPALTEIKQLVEHRRAPLVIEYRLNAGYIPLDHWVHGAQGGGRNIGEACHMYDVLRFLAGAPVRSIQAASIDPGALPYRRNDNFSATIGYEDGSLAHLLYTALGPKTGVGKERIEVFCDGETYLVDDFKRLIKGSDGSILWQSHEPDKGHYEELSRFGDAIAAAGDAPIAFDELIETSAVALAVEDLLVGRTVRLSGPANEEHQVSTT